MDSEEPINLHPLEKTMPLKDPAPTSFGRSRYPPEASGLSAYRKLLRLSRSALNHGKPENALVYAQCAASLASSRHLGFWRDLEIETLVRDIGHFARQEKPVEAGPHSPRSSPTVFLATAFFTFGGHAKVAMNWNEFLRERGPTHFIYTDTLKWSEELEWATPLSKPPAALSLWQRVGFLRDLIAEVGPRELLLFIHPDDVVAVAALHALPHRPKTFLFNHADHLFSVGFDIADRILESRPQGARFSAAERGIKSGCVIDLLPGKSSGQMTTLEKQKLADFESGNRPSLTIGSPFKMEGDPENDYFRMVAVLMRSRQSHRHFMISTHNEKQQRFIRENYSLDERLVFLGTVPDTTPYLQKAAFLIETFPWAGHTVRLEAVMNGLPVVAWDYPKCRMLSEFAEYLPKSYPHRSSTEAEMVKTAQRFIDDDLLRLKVSQELRNWSRSLPGQEEVGKALLAALDKDEGFRTWNPTKLCESEALSRLLRHWNRSRLLWIAKHWAGAMPTGALAVRANLLRLFFAHPGIVR